MSIWKSHPEAVEVLKTMIAQGQSCGVIASFLSGSLKAKVTRNAVIGKAIRLGLRSDPRLWKERAHLNTLEALRGKKRTKAQRPRVKPEKPSEPKPEPLPKARDFSDRVNAVRLLDRARNQCSFPISGEGAETVCCGNQVERGHFFCAACSAFAIQKGAA